MRISVQLDDDTANAVDRLRQEGGLGVSEAVNELIRRGLVSQEPVPRYRQPTRPIGLKIDVSRVPDALDLLERGDRD